MGHHRWRMCAIALGPTPYEQHRDYVLKVLGRRCAWLDRADREAVFHDAYALLLEKERGGELALDDMHPHQVRAYLVQTALYKALDEGKRAERKRAVPMGDEALDAPDAGRPLEDALADGLDAARVREIVDELPERRQAIVKLRYFLDCAPGEIQRLLGIRERVYRRELERAMRQIAEHYERVLDGSFCDSRRSLVMAYVAGLASPDRARKAQAHIDSCPGCRQWAVQLRDAAREVAALLPLPVLECRDGIVARVADCLTAARDQLGDATGGAKHHALAAVTRVDSGTAGMASAVRPGTVAAAIAGCIAVGGGATYCVVEGLPDPVRSLISRERPERSERRAQQPRDRAAQRQPAAQTLPVQPAVPAAQASPPASPAPAPATRTAPARSKPRPKPKARSATGSAPPPDPTESEFGAAGTPVPSSPAPAPSQPAAAAASSSSGGSGSSGGSASSGSSGGGSAPAGSAAPGEFDP